MSLSRVFENRKSDQSQMGNQTEIDRSWLFLICVLAITAWASPLLIWYLNVSGIHVGPAIAYGNNGYCDPWYYFGLASLADVASDASATFPTSRYRSRISGYFPNFLLGKILPGNAAEHWFLFTHTLSFVGAILAVRPIYGLGTAVLSAVLVSTSALWIGELSTTYVAGASLVYGMLALGCLTHAATSHRKVTELLLCVGAGVLLAWAVLAQLLAFFFFAFLPVVLLLKHNWRAPALYRDGAMILVGGLLGAALVGVAAMAIEQPFMLFWGQIQVAASIIGVEDWWDNNLIKKSVAIPLAIGLAGALLVKLRMEGGRSTTIVTAITALTTLALLAQFFIPPNSATLLFDFDYFLFLVPAVLSIAELTFTPSARRAAISIGVIIAANFVFMFTLARVPQVFASVYVSKAMAFTIVAASVVFVALLLRRYIVICLSVFALMQVAVGGIMSAHLFRDSRIEKDRFDLIGEAIGFAHNNGIRRNPVIWLATDLNDDLRLGVYRSFQRCDYEPSFPERLPSPENNEQSQSALAPGEMVIVLTLPSVTLGDIDRVIRANGMALADARSENFSKGRFAMRMTIGKVTTGLGY